MSFVIFGDLFSFPEGYAAANRVHCYAKGISESGISVHVICFSNEYLPVSRGVTDRTHYYYPFNQEKRSKYFVARRWKKFLKYINTLLLFHSLNKEEKITGINLWTTSSLTFIFGWLLSVIFHSKLLVECSEHPLRNYQGGVLRKMTGMMKFYFEAWLCDGVLCISDYIFELYSKSGIKRQKLAVIPSTVDPSRFCIAGTRPVPYRYLGYFGSLSLGRDNVGLLLKAFAVIRDQFPGLHLILGGYFQDTNERESIHNLIHELRIESDTEIVEGLSRQEIIGYIKHAEILVMVRGDDMESRASFPSKLTEYLTVSKPVITVNVGEISNFLKDGENAYLVPSGDVEEMAEKIKFIFSHYDTALKIASNGKKLTDGVFNYKVQSDRILDFLYQL